jgi:hypothetical protein
MFYAPFASGDPMFRGALNALGPSMPLLSYDGRYSPGNHSPSWTENKVNIATPIYRSKSDTLSVSLVGGDLHFQSPIVLDSGFSVPTDLYRIEEGTQFFQQLSNRKIWSLRTSIGYAGDQLSHSAGDISYSLNANYGFPGSGKGYWLVSIFFSSNSPLGNFVPIPGFGYFYKTATFTGLFGFPVTSMQWIPSSPWIFSFAFFGPTVQSEVAYGTLDLWQVFIGFSLVRQTYIPSQRTDNLYRLTVQEMKFDFGIRRLLWSSMVGELQIGRVFDRSIFLGDGLSDRSGGSASIANDIFVSLGLRIKL